MWCPAGHQAKELSCQETVWQPYRPLVRQSMAWRRLAWKLVLADKVATSAGAACPQDVAAPQESPGAVGEWPSCRQVLQAPVVEPWESSAAGLGLALQAKVCRAPLTAQNLSLCFFCYKTTSGGRAWAGIYSQNFHLMQGVPSCTEGHPGWECNRMSRQGGRGEVLTERSRDFKIQFFKKFDKALQHWGLRPVNKLPTIAVC